MPKGMVLQGQSRLFVVRLRDYFERECQNGGPLLPLSHVLARVAAALGISCATVSRITFEAYGRSGMEENELRTPKRKRRPCTVTAIDNINVEAIKHHINNYYLRKEMPTLRKLVISLRASGLYNGQKTSLASVLKKIGFTFKNPLESTTENTKISKKNEFNSESKKFINSDKIERQLIGPPTEVKLVTNMKLNNINRVPKEGRPKMRLVKVVMDPESDCSSLPDSNKVQKHRDDLDDTNFKYNSNMQLDNINLDWDSEDPCYLSHSEDDFITKDTS